MPPVHASSSALKLDRSRLLCRRNPPREAGMPSSITLGVGRQSSGAPSTTVPQPSTHHLTDLKNKPCRWATSTPISSQLRYQSPHTQRWRSPRSCNPAISRKKKEQGDFSAPWNDTEARSRRVPTRHGVPSTVYLFPRALKSQTTAA